MNTGSETGSLSSCKVLAVMLCVIMLCACGEGSSAGKAGSSVGSGTGEAEASGSGSSGKSGTAPAKDGTFQMKVSLSGGSGRATIESPCKVTVKEGKAVATIVWSSPYYDYMIVEGRKLLPINSSGNSVFEVPVASFDRPLAVTADTTAMSEPHEIEYKITFDEKSKEPTPGKPGKEARGKAGKDSPGKPGKEPLGKPGKQPPGKPGKGAEEIPAYRGHAFVREESLAYAKGFRLFLYEDGYRIIRVKGEEDLAVKAQGYRNIYLAATAGMSMVEASGGMERIKFSSVQKEKWFSKAAREAMEKGLIHFAGKYNAPDYELLLSGGCGLAIESTMIMHKPSVADKLRELDIPVFIDKSSYEADPMARCEWIKAYGALLGCEDQAKAYFDRESKKYEALLNKVKKDSGQGKAVCFFYINSNGQVVTRRRDDYIAVMIQKAGGRLLPVMDAKENGSGSVVISFEEFYEGAKEADILIYNGTIGDSIASRAELINKQSLFSDFRAVKNNRVYTCDSSLYQAGSRVTDIMTDLYSMMSGEKELVFFTKVK